MICLITSGKTQAFQPQADVSVGSFGADPRGQSDSTRAFSEAIDSLAKNGGGILFVPCGNYLLTSAAGTAAITIKTPTISISGANQSCTQLHYVGSGSALSIQMRPFTVTTAGRFSDFSIIGTANGAVGITTGSIVGATFQSISISGFTNGEAFRLEDRKDLAPPAGAWTERTVWRGVSEIYNKVGWHLATVGEPKNNSFGYNDFAEIYLNVSASQIGFWVDQGAYLYRGTFRAVCNADQPKPNTNPPTCVRSSGNWSDEFVWLSGEYPQSEMGSQAVSVQIDKDASFQGFGQILTSGMAVKDLASPKFEQNAHLFNQLSSWDTGLRQENFVQLTPQVAFGGRGGNFGIMVGRDRESPFASMYDAPGNAFLIGALRYGAPLSQMSPVWKVDNEGKVTAFGDERTVGRISAEQGVQPTSKRRPNCNAETRGTIWVEKNDGDPGDFLEVCQKIKGVFDWVRH